MSTPNESAANDPDDRAPVFYVGFQLDPDGHLKVDAKGDLTSPVMNALYAQALREIAAYISHPETPDGQQAQRPN